VRTVSLRLGRKGNFQVEFASGGKIEIGTDPLKEIKWQRKLGKGEVSVADFKKSNGRKVPNVMIIDAGLRKRWPNWGSSKAYRQHPLDEITKRMDEAAQG
jgi:hypothetical protein